MCVRGGEVCVCGVCEGGWGGGGVGGVGVWGGKRVGEGKGLVRWRGSICHKTNDEWIATHESLLNSAQINTKPQ